MLRSATCVVISPNEGYRGKQGFDYVAGVSAQTADAKGICMHTVVIPPLARATAHSHTHETAIYVLEGEAGMWYGEGLREHVTVKAGQFLYIPAGMPHLAYNPSDRATVRGILARTDPNDQETVVLYNAPDPGVPEI
ncbi:MAG TPA: cupin domain-containing protein [bacterium]|nr:cupin domain-containing protein [bacterium]